MIKLIFQTLWARRKRNVWVVLELVIVTMIMWVTVDAFVVNSYIGSIEQGYDEDRLFVVDIATNSSTSLNSLINSIFNSDPNKRAEESSVNTDNILRMLQCLRQVPGVESATIASQGRTFNKNGTSFPLQAADSTKSTDIHIVDFMPGTDYFRTFGIKNIDNKQYDEPENLIGGCIITNTAAKAMYPDVSPIGRSLRDPHISREELLEQNNTEHMIADVVGDVVMHNNTSRSLVAFKQTRSIWYPESWMLVVRKHSDVSDEKMLGNIKSALPQLRAGNLYARNPRPYRDISEDMKRGMEDSNKLSMAVMIFFMANICLALMATFYMQIHTRSRDVGIMRAYGFRKTTLLIMLLAEGWILTMVSWIIGTVIFFAAGFEKFFTTDHISWNVESTLDFFQKYMPMWYDDLLTRGLIIGSISLGLLLVIVTIGIWLPARRITSTHPIDTMRDY